MVINFKAREISRCARKLARTPILIKKNKKISCVRHELVEVRAKLTRTPTLIK
jgi:hypothetical protein